MRVVVLGANGMLGSATVPAWREAGHDVLPLTRADVDVTLEDHVLDVLTGLQPDVIINCVAYNHVDDAEDQPSAALAVNSWAVRALARASMRCRATLVHYSTDFVFDGCTSRPYREDDPPNPQSVYGASKLLGEWMAAEAGAVVLRVESLFGGNASRSTLDRMLESLRAGRPVSAFVDRTVSPSYVPDVVALTRRLVQAGIAPGVYHCVNAGYATWWQVATTLRDLAGVQTDVVAVRAADVPMKASRPAFAALSGQRLADRGFPLPTWRDALARHLGR